MARGRRGRGEPSPLSDLVPAAYPGKEPDDAKAIRAFAAWEKAVPARVAENARPVSFTKGTLLVHAATTVWAQEVDLVKEELLAKLRLHARSAHVRAIRVRVGKLPPRPVPPRERPAAPLVPVASLPEELARELARLPSDEVRDAVTKAASTSLGRDRPRRPVARRPRRA